MLHDLEKSALHVPGCLKNFCRGALCGLTQIGRDKSLPTKALSPEGRELARGYFALSLQEPGILYEVVRKTINITSQ
jgi:hypothetical protein